MKVMGLQTILVVFMVVAIQQNIFSQKRTEIIFHKSPDPERQKAPFSEAVQAGNLFFLAGQIGMDRAVGKLAEGGIQGETEQAIKNIQGVLARHGLTLDNVVKCTVILSDINDFRAFNEIYVKYFTKKPARTTYAAAGLAVGAKIEIDVTAVK
ncbi:Rid family detoxifying hydrolase [Allomuricauda sp. SCSIO 65647]|uniref:RidA family protein n=1 Tax=Allomuricauda sp. SCSIO 65647 TaxID=2908843 RepID=UPI0028BF1A55|nr:Rid family detoxifying hydrolase [Muricauda sp. SCSIO 65647]